MRALAALFVMLYACGSAEDGDQLAPPDALGGGGGAPVAVPSPPQRDRCKPAPGATGSPQTIEQAVALLNSLPKPTSAACFIESLDRPLTIFSTNSPFSAQPALSTRSPRVFIKTGQLWSSIVIDGEASELIEFGYLLPNTMRSIKGELHLPLETLVAPSAPFERVRSGEGTLCGLCHFHEQAEPLPGISNAFSSIAFRPRADSYVALDRLRAEAQACEWQSEPHRCEMLAAVFGGGEVVEGEFPSEMNTFF